MSLLFHPNIVLFMGACSEPQKLVMVTQVNRSFSVFEENVVFFSISDF